MEQRKGNRELKVVASHSYGIAINRKFEPGIDDPIRKTKSSLGLGFIVENAFEIIVAGDERYDNSYKKSRV